MAINSSSETLLPEWRTTIEAAFGVPVTREQRVATPDELRALAASLGSRVRRGTNALERLVDAKDAVMLAQADGHRATSEYVVLAEEWAKARALLRREVGNEQAGGPDPRMGDEVAPLRPPACLLPDDDTAVERLAAALSEIGKPYTNSPNRYAAAIIERLREGGRG